MADNTPRQRSNNMNLNIQSPLPSSTTGSGSNAPFTPRSSTFPDDFDSDSEFNAFDPTPMHSPGGPHYEDLPPSYDEAQQQALHDARSGIPPLDPNNLAVHQLALNDHQSSPPVPNNQLLSEVPVEMHAYMYETRENRNNADGLGMTVPVQHATSSERIPVGHASPGQAPTAITPSVHSSTTALDPWTLLNRALEFTRHETDADARYAPRLTRCVAIPQEGASHAHQRHRRGRGRNDRCGRGSSFVQRGDEHRMPGQWPEATSAETLNNSVDNVEEPVQFVRAYSKALHSHSIRPAEFMDFLDGLNALCFAMDTTPNELLHPDSHRDGPSSIVWNYIDAANEAFFAPRGLKVSLQSLSTLINALKVPEERGQRAGAVASALDDKSTSEQRAQALYPWTEKLETSVSEPTTQSLLLQELSKRLRRQSFSSSQDPPNYENGAAPSNDEKTRGIDESDPPHSIPEPYSGPGFNPLGSQAHHGGPGGGPGFGPFSFQGRGAHGWGGRGAHGWGGRDGHGWGGRGAHGWGGRGVHGWGGRDSHGWGGRGGHGWGPRGSNHHSQPNNDWAALGESLGKWGEEFGKRMGEWGEQFGRRAEGWGNDVGRRAGGWGGGVERRGGGWGNGVERRAEVWGEEPAGRASRRNTYTNAPEPDRPTAGASSSGDMMGQETGVHHANNISHTLTAANPDPKGKGKDEDYDDDASSISSNSSSSSDSDSEDEDEYPNTEKLFLERIRSINLAAETSRAKGKKSQEEIEHERSLAIEQAQEQKTDLEIKIAQKRSKRSLKKDLRRRKREIKREHRRVKKELKGLGDKEGRKKQKEEYRERKKEHRRIKGERKREHRRGREERSRQHGHTRGERRRGRRERYNAGEHKMNEESMVWLVVENLGA